MADGFYDAPLLPTDYQAKRFFEISPSWVADADVGLRTEDWSQAPLTTTLCFAALEALYGEAVPSSGQFMFKKRPKAIPDYVWATGKVPIVTAIFKAVVEAMAPGEAEFRPFAMRWPDDEPVAGEWYLMNILNLVDCFDFERMGWPRPEFTTRRPITGDVLTPFEVWFQARLDQNYQSRPVYIDPQPAELLHILASSIPFRFRVLHERVARGAEGGRGEAAERGAARHARASDPGDRLGCLGRSCTVIRLEIIFFERRLARL